MQVTTDVMTWFFRRSDQSWEGDRLKAPYKTKKTQVNQYVDLHSGPSYIVYVKYSTILNVAYVTMMYGVGMPALFPIAVVTYWIMLIHEKYHMAYTY